MLLKFYNKRDLGVQNSVPTEIWINVDHIEVVGERTNCICIWLNSDSNIQLCPEHHPLGNLEEVVKLINQAKRKS